MWQETENKKNELDKIRNANLILNKPLEMWNWDTTIKKIFRKI